MPQSTDLVHVPFGIEGLDSMLVLGFYGTPLLPACNARQEEVALLLRRKGADPTDDCAVNPNFDTVLEAAIVRGLENIVKTIVENHSAAPRPKEFVMAVETGNERIVQILWDSNKLEKEDLDSALVISAQEGHDVPVLLLLRLWADINHRHTRRNYEGPSESALEVARRFGYSNVVSVLLEEGADDVFDVQYEDSDEKSRGDVELDEGEELDEDQYSAEPVGG